MADNAYIHSLGSIRASDAFKQGTIAKMQAAAQNTAAHSPATLAVTPHNRRRNIRIGVGLAACLVVAVVAIFATPLLRGDLSGTAIQNSAPAAQSTGEAMMDTADEALPEATMAPPDTATGSAERDGAASIPTSYAAKEPEEGADLPLLTVEENWGGMGFEGYMAYDISELVNGNPWTAAAELETLPVYTNTVRSDRSGQPTPGLDADAMLALAREAAAALGFTEESSQLYPTDAERTAYQAKVGEPMPDNGVQRVTLTCDGGDITVEPNGEVVVELQPPVALPEGYSFTHYDTTLQQARETLAWLAETYAPLVDMQQPTQDIFGGNYNIYAQQGYNLSLYEGTGTLTEQIVSYHFNHIGFANDDDGLLSGFRRTHTDLSEKLGDYPILTAQQAQALLVQGHYITTVPEEMPGESHIAKVELVYRTENWAEVFIPYYRFYVEVPALARDGGLKTYGAYYVPAVAEDYIANMPLWDGSFN